MEKSPVCSLFSVRTDRVEMGIFGSKTERTLLTIPDSREDDNDVNRNDAIECMRSPGEDDHVEMSMKSVILSSDEYSSSSESEEEDNSRGNKEKGKEEATKPHQDLVKHKPPKSKWSEKLGEVIELEKLNSGDTDLAVVSSIVLSSDEYSQDSGEDNIFTTDITDTELTKPVVCLPKKPVLKKRVSFGSIKDEYWEEHWNTFWWPQSAIKVEANDDVNDLESDKVNSREFIPSIIDLSTGTNENGTDSDDVCKITTSTPSHLLGNRKLGDIMGSSSSDGFSPMDTGNSNGDSAQEAILRAIAVLECSEDSRSSNIKMQSITPETQSSCPESESSHTSEWESDIVTSGSSISNLSSKEHLTDIARAGSIDEMANIISKACTQHAVQTVKALSTQTPLQQGHRFLSPSESFVPRPLVSIPRILYASSTPITNLASQLYEHAMSESCEQRLENIDVYMTVKSERVRIVASNDEESKRLRFNQKDVKVAPSRNENIGFGNKKLWEWNNNFLLESSEIGKWESVQELMAVEQVAESIVKPTTLADEFLISQRPRIRDDATLIANLNVHNGWCQTKFFPSVKSNTPTPAKRRRSYFPDLTGDLQEPEESLLATPRIRYFKSPGSPEHSLDADHVPDSCDRVSVTEKLPMLHNIGSSPPVVGKIYEGSDKPRLDDDKYWSSPVIPYMRGKLSTTIDVLQESPESGRYSKELDVSDPKSVESTPIGDSYSSPDVVECSFEDSTVNSLDGDIVSFSENAHNGQSPNNNENSLTKLSENKNVKNDVQNLGDACDTTPEFSKGSLEFDTPNKCPEPDWKLPKEMDLPVRPRESEENIRSFTTGLYPNKQTSGYNVWSNYDGNECIKQDLDGRGEKLCEGVGPVVTSESSSHNAAETTADSNFHNGEIRVKRHGSAVEHDAILNKEDGGGNQVSDNPELTNEQEVIDITHEETTDSTYDEINDNTNEEVIIDTTNEEEMNDNTSGEVINDSTNEAVINNNTNEEVIIDTTNEEEMNDNTSEEVINDSTNEAVINNNTNEEEIIDTTNEEEMNDNTSEEVINDSRNEAVINNNTNEEEIIDTTNEEEMNDNRSEAVINNNTNEEIIDTTNEDEINDTTNDVEINDSVGEVTLSEDEASNNGNLEDTSEGNDEISNASIQDDVDHYGNVDRPSEEEAFDNEDNSCTETLNRDFVHEDDMNETESSQYNSSAKDKDMNHIFGTHNTTAPPLEENCGNGVDDLDPVIYIKDSLDDIGMSEQGESDTDTKNNDEDMKKTSRENDKDQDDAEEEYRKEYCRNRIYDVNKAFEETVDENEDNSWETINSDSDLDGAETFHENERVRER